MLKQSCSSLKSAMAWEGRVGAAVVLLQPLLLSDDDEARDRVTAFLCW